MVKFVIINGLGGCGKSTFIELCQKICTNPDNYQFRNWLVTELSTVDFVKEIARECGWKGTKEKKDREFLHDLKMAMETWGNIPNKKTLEEANVVMKNYLGHNHIFFVNIREPQSIESFSQLVVECKYEKPYVILLKSNKISNEVESIAEEMNSVSYTRVYRNDGTLDDLEDIAEGFLKEIINADL